MAISEKLLEILVCPDSKQELSLAPPSVAEAVNAKIATGTLITRKGKLVDGGAVDGVLLRSDKERIYLIREGIPIMLSEEAILTEGLDLSV